MANEQIPTNSPPPAQGVPTVYSAITAVTEDLADVGIGKSHKNNAQGFHYRGIDDVYNILSRILAKNHLCILPRVISRELSQRVTGSGSTLYVVVLEVEYDIVSAIDASKHTIHVFGEAMDSADKATNKAMSAAYKYACFQTFCIPVDAIDADADSHPPTKPYNPDATKNTKVNGDNGTKTGTKTGTKSNTTTKAAAKEVAIPPRVENAQPMTLEALADFALSIEEVTDEAQVRQLAADLYTHFKSGAITRDRAVELAGSIASVGARLATARGLSTFEKIVTTFLDAQLIDIDIYEVAVAATRSRLNVAPKG